MNSSLICASRGVGNSSCCSRGCCCSGPGEEAKCPRRPWRNVSTCSKMVDGWNCCASAGAQVHQSSVRRRRRQHQDDGIQKRVDRAHNLVQLGELSAVRQALEGANMAPGNLATLGGVDEPGQTTSFPQTRVESRDPSFRTSRAVRVGWRRFPRVLEDCSAGCSSWTLGDDRRPLVPNLGE